MRGRVDLTEIIAKLEAEPLTHLMLGHRELFHSNLLAWFFEYLPDAADLVFGCFTTASARIGDVRKADREKQKFDLWLQWPNRHPVLIENKVFSLPDEQQLAEYSTKAGAHKNPIYFYLLSLCDPKWPDNRKTINGREWRGISYRDLSKSIRAALPADDASYAIETMHHYAIVIELLSQLADSVLVTHADETVALPTEAANALAHSRLMAPMAKFRARSVAHCIEEALLKSGSTRAKIETNVTRSQPLNEWFQTIKPTVEAGWQLQGNQFRLALRSRVDLKERISLAEGEKEIFDFSYLDEIIGTEEQPIRPSSDSFNRYNPDFIYRYKKVSPDLTVKQLAKAAIAIAERITSGKVRLSGEL